MWIPYIENHIPTKIHAYLDHNLETYLVDQILVACWLVKFTKNTVGTSPVLRDHMGIFLKPIST
jgi:hypothetical protein